MNNLKFLLGAAISKLCNHPSKDFAITLAGILFLASPAYKIAVEPLISLIPGFFMEWYSIGFGEQFAIYLFLFSCMLLVFAYGAWLAKLSFKMAVYVYNKHKVALVPW